MEDNANNTTRDVVRQSRQANGRFLPEHPIPGPGRPRLFEEERQSMAAELRRQLKRHKLVPDRLIATSGRCKSLLSARNFGSC